jgi:hypothetical protein
VQALGAEHETPARYKGFGMLGVRWVDHLMPFQRSINTGLLRLALDPTATQNLGEAQDNPIREASCTVADGCIDQRAPFQCSASATLTLLIPDRL